MRNQELLQLFSRLSKSTEGDRLLKYLKTELADQDRDNRILDGNLLFRGQGKAQCLHNLVELLEQSHGLLQSKK